MRRYLLLLLPLVLHSCIENNIPYPVVELYITSVEGDGFVMNDPDNVERTIVLSLEEDTNIEEVRFSSINYSPDIEFTSTLSLDSSYNLNTPLSVTLSLYQDYVWIISAEQIVERYFSVQNQIGSAVFDLSAKTATAYVSESTDLSDITVQGLKLGPADITTYDVTLDELTQFSSYRVVNISYHNTTERWKLYVEQTDVKVSISQSDVRATTAALTAEGDTSTASASFSYRTSSTEDWTEVDTSEIVVGDGSFSTTIKGLESNTDYEFVASLGEDSSEIISATTESILPLPNGDFEQWSFPATYNGSTNRSWFPFLEDGEQYWGTGNQGGTTLGESYNLTTPTEDTCPESTGVLAASLQSKNTLKFATGSIFTGAYLKTAGTNGIIGLGRPFTSRPVGIRGWVKYTQGIVDMVGTIPPGVDIVKGETPDQGSIYMALGTWSPEEYGTSAYETESLGTDEIPLIIDTRDSATFFNKNGEDVVAYGELIISESIDEWSQFEITLDYNTLDELPTHIIIVCSASRYGDYFTGSSASNMTLDDLEIVWE
ncbi:MAG: PCMD domain-containing protein [Rikenellaceae bacterium]